MMAQHIADGVLTGAILSLGAIGVTLSMSVLRFANFGHSELITWGAYAALVFLAFTGLGQPLWELSVGWQFFAAAPVAGALTGLLAVAIDTLVFARLRRRSAARLTMIFASFGAALVLRNIAMLAFGGEPAYYTRELQMAVEALPGVRVMADQVMVLAVTLAAVTLLFGFLKFTRTGLAMRAIAETPVLAEISGINAARVARWTWVLSGALAALAGMLFGLTVQLRPEMGFTLLLPLFAAAILGGAGSVAGAVAGGFIIGLAENLSVMVISPGYKSAVPFMLMLVILYLRPAGLFGARK